MLRSLLSTAIVPTLLTLSAQANPIWADGVSAEGGWYDANKTHEDDHDGNYTYPNDSTGKGARTDDAMCYAAAAANILSWWQARYELPDGIPTAVNGTDGKYSLTGNDIWSVFVQNSQIDGGLNTAQAMIWYLSGEAQYRTGDLYFPQTSGYFTDYIPNNSVLYNYSNSTDEHFIQKYNGTAENLIHILQDRKTPAALSLNASHTITLWGAELEGNRVTHLYITDSDDYNNVTELLTVDIIPGEDNSITFTLDNKNYTITTIYTINPEISDTWGLTRINIPAIPEPATATLSLLALAALTTRRRR